ncbi:cell adhesion molecule-like protein [Dinothrombium tinctorium]|uniref:Cell adhesion molecule-like protein n=1 Tax=Dinothrombium tinctorium TaxID=1965070 RepID=A0A3S3PHF4_9ACAR|nr:cell adhesion molecule-like protein [Dinothrombium tinctorium]
MNGLSCKNDDMHNNLRKLIWTLSVYALIEMIITRIAVDSVVKQNFVMEVYDEFIVSGNTAVFRCHIPSFVRDYLTITAWIEEPTGRTIQPTGTILASHTSITGVEGELIVLPCAAQGFPIPTYRWYRKEGVERVQLSSLGERFTLLDGILIVKEVKLLDGGVYVCVVNNSIGEERAETEVIVRAPLVAKMIPWRQSIDVGKSALLNCSVSGHPITTIVWEKDHKRIKPGYGNADIRLLAKDLLHIDSVQKDHRGMYQCFVFNDYESVTAIAELTLGVRCPVAGYPIDLIAWERAGLRLPYNHRQKAHDNGTLEVHHVERPTDEGAYTCVARNNKGQQAQATVYVSVKMPPRWVIEPSDGSVVRGRSLSVDCQAEGFPVPRIRWTKAEGKQARAVLALSESTIKINAFHSPGSSPRNFKPIVSSPHLQVYENGSLTLHDARDADGGYYLCQASNRIGSGLSKVVKVTVNVAAHFKSKFTAEMVAKGQNIRLKCEAYGDIPIAISWTKDKQKIDNQKETISNFVMGSGYPSSTSPDNRYEIIESIVEITSRSVKLAWSPPYSGNSPITNYYIQYRAVYENSKKVYNVTIPSGESFGQVTGLKPAVKYVFTLVAENRMGRSESGRSVEATCDEEAPGGPPTKVHAQAISSKAIKVTWKPPNKDLQYGVIKGYYIGYKAVGSSDSFIYKTLDLHVTSTTSSSIHLNWEPIADDNNPIDGYLLYERREPLSEWREIRLQGHQTLYVGLNLNCGTRYQYYLVAYNKIGRGDQSDTITVKTDGSVPVAPDKQSVVTMNTTTATIHLSSWHHGGCPIKSFRVRYRLQGGKSDWTEIHNINEERQLELQGLQPAKKYNLQITASNEVGFTEAEYAFSTLSLIPDELGVRSSTKFVRGGQKAATYHLGDYSVVIPVVISTLVICILLIVVCIVVKRGSAIGTNGSLYSAVIGRKQESLQMTNLSKNGRSPYITGHETLPKMNGECAHNQGHMETEPLYATVKRTPRPPRTDAHIYSYPVPVSATQAESLIGDPSLPMTSVKTMPATTLVVNVEERDLETKLLELAPCGTHLRRYSVGQT